MLENEILGFMVYMSSLNEEMQTHHKPLHKASSIVDLYPRRSPVQAKYKRHG